MKFFKHPEAENNAGSEDDLQLKYNPSFEAVLRPEDDDGSSVPPPPPAGNGRGMFRSNNKKRNDEEAGHGPPIQITVDNNDEEDESVEVETAQYWLNSIKSPDARKGGRRRRGMLCVGLMAVVVVIAVAVAVSGNDKNSGTVSESNSAITAPPTPAPLFNETDAATFSPTASPSVAGTVGATDAATVGATDAATDTATDAVTDAATDAATSVVTTPATEPADCVDLILAGSVCYGLEDRIDILFQNCAAEADDWIGVWPLEDAMDSGNLPEPKLWFWTCGNQNCQGEVEEGDVLFGSGVIGPGFYVAHLLRLDSDFAPYFTSYASSVPFEVSETC